MKYYLADNIVEFDFGKIPILGNLDSGNIIGLTNEGKELINLIKGGKDFHVGDITKDQLKLLEVLLKQKFALEKGIDASSYKEAERNLSAYIHVTNWCNLSCVGCYSLDQKRNTQNDMNLEQIKTILRDLKDNKLNKLIISGGEPFLRTDLEGIVKFAKELGVETHLITNGTLITYSRAKKLQPYVDSIAISIDGFNEENPNFIRGTSRKTFEKIINGIGVLNSLGIKTSLISTMHSKNYEHAERYVELAKSLNSGINFSIFTCNFNEIDFKDFKLTDEQLKDISCTIFSGKLNVDDTSMKAGELRALTKCGAGSNLISIDTNGIVYPCHMLHSDELSMGDIKYESIGDILERKSINWPDVNKVESCCNCEYKFLCGSGCRARAYLNTQDLLEKDPYCILFNNYYKLFEDKLNNQYC